MIAWNKRVAIASVFFAHLACGYSTSPLDKLSTRELKEQHDEVVKKIDVWLKRQEDAIPKEFMTEERKEILKLAQAASNRVRELQQRQRVLDGQRIHAETHLANIRRQKATCETDLRAATKTHAQLRKKSEEWRKRSTSEKANRTLADLEEKLANIEQAYYNKPLFERWGHPLHRV